MNLLMRSKITGIVLLACIFAFNPILIKAEESADKNVDLFSVRKALYEVKKGETLEDIARRFMGGAEYINELMEYNRIKDATAIKEGFILVLPGTDRAEALKKIESGKEALVLAREAMAETYAAEEYEVAASTISQSEENLRIGNYDKSTALGELGRARALQATRLADERAVIEQSGIITAANGKVDVSVDGEKTWRPVELNDEFPVKAVIRTGVASRAELTLGDGTVMQIHASTKFLISKFKFDQRNDKRESEMQVYIGNVLGKVAHRKNKKSTFKVHSRSTVLAIRGTNLRVGTDLVQTTRVAVLDGDVQVTARKKDIDIPGNFGTLVEPGDAPKKPIKLLPPPVTKLPAADPFSTSVQTINFEWDYVEAGGAAKAVTELVGSILEKSIKYHLEIATDLKFNYVVQDHYTKKNYLKSDVLKPGEYFWRVATIDRNGLEGPSTEPAKLRILRDLFITLKPDTPPVVRDNKWIIGPTNVLNVLPIRSNTSIVSLIYSLNNGSFRNTDGRIFLHSDGEYLLKVRAIGADGHLGQHIEQTIVVDTRGPTISSSVSPVSSDPVMGDVVFVSFDVTDASGVGTIEYRINDDVYRPYSGRLKVSVANEYVGVHVQAVDVFGKTFMDKHFKPSLEIKVDCHAVDIVGNRTTETLTLAY